MSVGEVAHIRRKIKANTGIIGKLMLSLRAYTMLLRHPAQVFPTESLLGMH